jgi:hypothetical protein
LQTTNCSARRIELFFLAEYWGTCSGQRGREPAKIDFMDAVIKELGRVILTAGNLYEKNSLRYSEYRISGCSTFMASLCNTSMNSQTLQRLTSYKPQNQPRERSMYKIEKKDFGYKLTFDGFIEQSEMNEWVNEAESALSNQSGPFGVFVDMRTLKPLDNDAQKEMEKGQKLFKLKGMERSVVILNNAITTLQFQRIAKQSGIDAWERYIDASAEPSWEQKGIAWIKDSVEP